MCWWTLRVVFGVLTSSFHVWDGNHWIVLPASFSAKLAAVVTRQTQQRAGM
jgi:hypothetical protein